MNVAYVEWRNFRGGIYVAAGASSLMRLSYGNVILPCTAVIISAVHLALNFEFHISVVLIGGK